MTPRAAGPPGTIRIGCGAGYAGDRIEPAVDLAVRGELDYLVFECLAERTIALRQRARRNGERSAGADPMLAERMTAVLPACRQRGVRVITNMGAADPLAAAAVTIDIARAERLLGLTVVAVTGDDVLDEIRRGDYRLEETGRPVRDLGDRLLSANAYIGAEPIVAALRHDADVVIGGRVADPSLFLAPQIDAFGWTFGDWARLGQGTVVGHLLECAGQVTGGYLADPETLPVEGLSELGFPLAEVSSDGTAVITKLSGTGGAVSLLSCKAQLLYEIHDPAAYLTPDVTADFTGVRFTERGPDRIAVQGATGRPRPDRLKVSVGYLDGYIGEGQISYAGAGAVARARLAGEIVRDRLRTTGVAYDELRVDLIGLNAMHGIAARAADPYEVRLRVAGRTAVRAAADRIGREVEALYTNGPAAGGGAVVSVRDVVAMGTTFVPRSVLVPALHTEVIR